MVQQPREHLTTFGDGGNLVGTVTLPVREAREGGASSIGFILFNAGVISRVGPHRLNVKLARHFAERGTPTLRFDLSGQGDSLAPQSTAGFERQSVADVRTAMDTMCALTGTRRFVLFGICSGAVLSYAAALEDPRIVGCVMLDPYMYPTRRTHLNRVLARIRRVGVRKVGLDWLLRKFKTLGVVAKASSSAGSVGPAGGLGLTKPTQKVFATGLSRLLDRGVKMMMIYSGSALYTYNYAGQFDDGFRRFGLAGRMRADFLPEIDHTVTELAAQRQLIAHLTAWFDGNFPPGAEAGLPCSLSGATVSSSGTERVALEL